MSIKFYAWWATRSNAVLTDALESIINIVAGAFALFSLIIAAKPKDLNHPYGHGKIEFISVGFEGALIALAGIGMICKGGYNFFFPQTIHQLDLGIWLTGLTGVVNFAMGWWLEKRGKKDHSVTLTGSGKHLQTDGYSSLGLLLGLALVWLTNLYVLDNILAIIFGMIILFTGYNLLRKSLAGIMDEADYQLITRLVEVMDRERQDNWIDIHNFRVIQYGASLHIDCHMTLPWYFDNRQSHQEIKVLEKLIEENCSAPVELFIHIDACTTEACRICQKQDCNVRASPTETRLPWTIDNIMENMPHKV
ncbi:MAG: cation transporter [Saprospiraceae bacterium]|nr:MAG: cation transporter [Saprospiraceae bacterium]